MTKTIGRDIPLSEITLRRYEKPSKEISERELVRRVCLSLGLLQPGDSRDVVTDVFYVMLNASKNKKMLTSDGIKDEVVKLRKKNNLPLKGIAESNVRRQLKRLRNLFLVEKLNNEYRITEWENISVIFDNKIEKYYLENIKNRIKEYINELK